MKWALMRLNLLVALEMNSIVSLPPLASNNMSYIEDSSGCYLVANKVHCTKVNAAFGFTVYVSITIQVSAYPAFGKNSEGRESWTINWGEENKRRSGSKTRSRCQPENGGEVKKDAGGLSRSSLPGRLPINYPRCRAHSNT